MQTCPSWCATHRDCWAAIVDKWVSDEWRERHALCRECHLQMGGPAHHQGNQPLSSYAQAWVHVMHLFIYLF
jgi:hypothetical protein